jgi:hypothetical protein
VHAKREHESISARFSILTYVTDLPTVIMKSLGDERQICLQSLKPIALLYFHLSRWQNCIDPPTNPFFAANYYPSHYNNSYEPQSHVLEASRG